MGSTEAVFHFFPLLPFELRREIYILATPPRIVHVEEGFELNEHDREECAKACRANRYREGGERDWLYDRFEQTLRGGGTLQIRLHPDIAYFAHNWRVRLPPPALPRQTLLEDWGFTSRHGGAHQPWPPSAETPEIPLHWLAEHPQIAFELVRESFLYSRAPIPPLLHTCSESRQVLVDLGYELSFSTRTSEPQTWFHFGRDKLYLGTVTYNEALLSGGYWDVFQFSPKDLRRIQYLILGETAQCLLKHLEMVANLLPLLPNLQELFFEIWGKYFLDPWLKHQSTEFYGKEKFDLHQQHIKSKHGSVMKPWTCIPVEDIDAVGQTCWDMHTPLDWQAIPLCNTEYLGRGHLCYFGHSPTHFDNDQRTQDGQTRSASAFEALAGKVEEKLSSPSVATSRGFPKAHWNIPRMRFVHTGSEAIVRIFSDGRHQFWRYFVALQEEFARSRPFQPLTVDAPMPPYPFRVTWSYWPWDTDNWPRVFGSLQRGHIPDFEIHPSSSYLRAWYLIGNTIREPSLELL